MTRRLVALVLVLVLGPLAAPAPGADAPGTPDGRPGAYWVFVGTYTGAKSKGIYRAKLDARTGKLSEPELAAELTSPSFLAVHPNNKFLYAVGETGGKDGGGVFAFALDPKAGTLAKLDEKASGGDGPCHVALSPNGGLLAVANYGGGSTALFRVGADGKLGDRQFVQHKGSGVNQARQGGPHAHCAAFTPCDRFLLVADLGLDRVKAFGISGFGENPVNDIALPAGSGPRHLAVTRNNDYAFVCGELDSTVNAVELHYGGGHKVVQTLSTLPVPVKGNSTAECILSPDEQFVYVSNRGHNSVAAFKRGGRDKPRTAAGHITGDIKTPRNFAIDPSGAWMLIASQDGDKVGVWQVDPGTGLAKETGGTIAVGRPVCVRFVPIP